MNRWKYFIGPGLWREQSTLYRSLDEALLAVGTYDNIGLVPSGHAPWKPFAGHPAHETTKFRAELTGRPWEVLRISRYATIPDAEPHTWHLAAFLDPRDAFLFAESKTKQAVERGDKCDTFFVILRGWTEDHRQPEIARMPADHLTQLRRIAERERKRREKRSYRHAA